MNELFAQKEFWEEQLHAFILTIVVSSGFRTDISSEYLSLYCPGRLPYPPDATARPRGVFSPSFRPHKGRIPIATLAILFVSLFLFAGPATGQNRIDLRTNLLYDAFLLPTIGVEWRVSPDWGIKLDGSLAWWDGKSDKVQKVWLLNPELRRYLLRDRRFYMGASGSYGEYNFYKYLVGSLFSKNTGYQGTVWSAGLTVGYQLCLSHRFSVDFNLGLGYARSEYDSYGMTDGVRVYKAKNQSKNFFGPTQAGISLVWTIGSNK